VVELKEKQRLASKREVADYIGMSERYVHGMLQRGELTPVPMGRHRKIDLNEVDALIDARKRDAVAVRLAG
jgi:excisionase family DNA binding protein